MELAMSLYIGYSKSVQRAEENPVCPTGSVRMRLTRRKD